LDSSKKNELRYTICEPLICYQEVILLDHPRFEKSKINRQYLWAATFPVDEAGYLSHYKYSIYKEFYVYTGHRTMGNVYVYQRAADVFLGNGNNSIAPPSLQQE
jgi:hypothetical protein